MHLFDNHWKVQGNCVPCYASGSSQTPINVHYANIETLLVLCCLTIGIQLYILRIPSNALVEKVF